jgi:hypothetical protein
MALLARLSPLKRFRRPEPILTRLTDKALLNIPKDLCLFTAFTDGESIGGLAVPSFRGRL